jgi:hypothetical protein
LLAPLGIAVLHLSDESDDIFDGAENVSYQSQSIVDIIQDDDDESGEAAADDAMGLTMRLELTMQSGTSQNLAAGDDDDDDSMGNDDVMWLTMQQG